MLGSWPSPQRLWSRELRSLLSNLEELDSTFLNWAESLAIPAPRDSTEALYLDAFVMAAHAHLERYLEEICGNFAEELYRLCKQIGSATALTAMERLVWAHQDPKQPRVRLQPLSHQLLLECKNRYIRDVIRRNNGIGKGPLSRMLEPFGLYVADLGPVVPGLLASAGDLRGDIAHGAAIGALAVRNAKTDVDLFVGIVSDLYSLEHLLLQSL